MVHSYAHPWAQTGQHGVTIFLVLSAFLITSKLPEGPIDLKRFYIRRFFRLMPREVEAPPAKGSEIVMT